jgi:prophage antirepressor-like protein
MRQVNVRKCPIVSGREEMKAIMKVTNHFEGYEITTLTYRGKPAWIAREIGEAIGYSNGGKRLATKITGEWAGEFIDGYDHVLLAGKELADFKAVFEGTDSVPLKSNRGAILLFESGLYLVITKTNKPAGKRLRRFLAKQVLPQIARDGRYFPERQVKDGQIGNRNGSVVDPRIAREERLARRLEFEDRKTQTKALKDLVKALRESGNYEENVLIAYEVAAAEAATGQDLTELKPATERWLSLSEIADKVDITIERLELIVGGLRKLGEVDGLYPPGTVETIVEELVWDDEWCASHDVRCRYVVEPISPKSRGRSVV